MYVVALFLGFGAGVLLLGIPDRILSLPPPMGAVQLKRKAPNKAWVTWAFPVSYGIFWFVDGLSLYALFRPIMFESPTGAFFFVAAVACGMGILIGCYEVFFSVSPLLRREAGLHQYRLLTEGSARIGASRLLWTTLMILGAWAAAQSLG
jgi:hypothetical protein